ncbi:MAG TPA: serine/threonine-protein kinase [Solirubrobacterales bacterium]|nr:serine/threonine-protein kinase [Solirubrobacterales bacterium]
MAFDDQPTDEMRQDPAAATDVAGQPLLVRNRRLRDGRYVLERSLGHGGMAAVWLAYDVLLERPVAIKVLSDTIADDEEFLARFQREARVAAGLSHPNLVNVFDFEAGGARPFLVMEYVDGGDLAQRLASHETTVDVGRLSAELLDALRYIHGAGVLHRDVKPQNVLMTADGQAKLTDFGIAQPLDATSLTATGKVLGTERYLAPEVMGGAAPSERSDLFAVGVVLAEAARESVSFGVWELIDQLRSPRPEERPVSALAALAELERRTPGPSLPGSATQGYEPPPPPPAEATPQPLTPQAPTSPPTAPGSDAPPAADDGEPARDGLFSSPDRRLVLGGLAALLVAVAVAVGLGLSGDEGDPVRDLGAQVQNDSGDGSASEGHGSNDQQTEAPPPETTTEPTTTTPEPESGTSGAALNDQGFALIQEGHYEEAIPILQRAVEALAPEGGLTHAYALFNLGNALRLAGRPEEAIPILEQRLEFPDQSEVVQRELALARAEAGQTDSSGPGNGPGNAFGHEKNGKDEGDD